MLPRGHPRLDFRRRGMFLNSRRTLQLILLFSTLAPPLIYRQAPDCVRAAALRALGSYCGCSATIARSWSPRLLEIAADNDECPESLRCVAVQVWGKLGPQCSGEELRLAALLRPPPGLLSGTFDKSDESSILVSRVFSAPAPVRVEVVVVLSKLAAAEKVKRRRCLCRLAEVLADQNPRVQVAAVAAVEAYLDEVRCIKFACAQKL